MTLIKKQGYLPSQYTCGLEGSWDTAFSVPKPGKFQANWEELVTVLKGKRNKKLRLELKQHQSQEPGLGIIGHVCIWSMFVLLPEVRYDYKIVSFLTWPSKVTEGPCPMLILL